MGVCVEHSAIGSAYNTKLVSPKDVPKSYEDLLDPKWKGKKIAVDTEMKLFIYLTPHWGEQKVVTYLKKLREQNPTFSASATQQISLLATGEFSIAVGMHLHRTAIFKGKGAPVEFAPISPGVIQMAPEIVPRYAPHPNAGRLFMHWWLTPEGQAVVSEIRRKGNPMPGSGTIQSKAVEKLGISLVTTNVWEVDTVRLAKVYEEAIGFKK